MSLDTHHLRGHQLTWGDWDLRPFRGGLTSLDRASGYKKYQGTTYERRRYRIIEFWTSRWVQMECLESPKPSRGRRHFTMAKKTQIKRFYDESRNSMVIKMANDLRQSIRLPSSNFEKAKNNKVLHNCVWMRWRELNFSHLLDSIEFVDQFGFVLSKLGVLHYFSGEWLCTCNNWMHILWTRFSSLSRSFS